MLFVVSTLFHDPYGFYYRAKGIPYYVSYLPCLNTHVSIHQAIVTIDLNSLSDFRHSHKIAIHSFAYSIGGYPKSTHHTCLISGASLVDVRISICSNKQSIWHVIQYMVMTRLSTLLQFSLFSVLYNYYSSWYYYFIIAGSLFLCSLSPAPSIFLWLRFVCIVNEISIGFLYILQCTYSLFFIK